MSIQTNYRKNISSDVLVGGAFPFPRPSGSAFYILAKIAGDTLDRINERRENVGLDRLDDLHITLLHLFVNKDHPNFSDIFENPDFYDAIKNAFDTHILTKNVKLVSRKVNSAGRAAGGNWEILGRDGSNKFMARVYTLVDQTSVHNVKMFRLAVYGYINNQLRQRGNIVHEDRGTLGDVETFHIVSYGGNELYAINDYYYGLQNWKPHISVIGTKDIRKQIKKVGRRQPLVDAFEILTDGRMPDDDKIERLRGLIGNVPNAVRAISDIHAGANMGEIRISRQWLGPRTDIDM